MKSYNFQTEIILARFETGPIKTKIGSESDFRILRAQFCLFYDLLENLSFEPTLKFEQSAADRAIELFSRKFAQEDRSLRSAIWCE